MAVIKGKTVLRKPRKDEKIPYYVKLDKVNEGDTFIFEIVLDKKNSISQVYKFTPEQLSGRKSMHFRISGGEVFWLSKLNPERIYEKDLSEITPETDTGTYITAGSDWRHRKRGPQIRKVMIFDEEQNFIAICSSLEEIARITNILPEAIDKMCKSKKQSLETNLSFRYFRKSLGININDFDLTLDQYDEMCKRKPKEE